jgi:hypothetical protein
MMNDAIELGLPTVIGITFSLEAGLVTITPSSGDAAGVDDGHPAVAGLRIRN